MANRLKSRRLVAVACFFCASTAFAGDPALSDQDADLLDLSRLQALDLLQSPPPSLVLPLGTVKPFSSFRTRFEGRKAALLSSETDDGAVVLGDGLAALDWSGPDAGDLTGGAVLNLNLPEGAVKAKASASAGKDAGHRGYWHKDAARIEARLSGPLGTALDVSGENQLSLTYRTPESVGAPDTKAHLVRTASRSGRLNLTVPVDPIAVNAGGTLAIESTQEGVPGDEASFVRSAVRTESHTAYVKARWQPLPGIALEGGTKARAASIRWQNAHASTYRSADPYLKVDVRPWNDTAMTAKLEQTVAPYDAAAFASYARADTAADASGFQPDHAWQIETRVEQRVGPVSVTAIYTSAREGTVTEFAVVGGVQAPATAPLLGRESVAVAIEMPLSAIGLPRTDLKTEARWQTSRVIDPVTSETRSASGEPEHKLSLRLAHNLPADNLSLGLTGEFTGEHASYQVQELSTASARGSVGAFIAYKPGRYRIDLNVNGLVGATTRDVYFHGRRSAATYAERTTLTGDDSTVVKLSLRKAF